MGVEQVIDPDSDDAGGQDITREISYIVNGVEANSTSEHLLALDQIIKNIFQDLQGFLGDVYDQNEGVIGINEFVAALLKSYIVDRDGEKKLFIPVGYQSEESDGIEVGLGDAAQQQKVFQVFMLLGNSFESVLVKSLGEFGLESLAGVSLVLLWDQISVDFDDSLESARQLNSLMPQLVEANLMSRHHLLEVISDELDSGLFVDRFKAVAKNAGFELDENLAKLLDLWRKSLFDQFCAACADAGTATSLEELESKRVQAIKQIQYNFDILNMKMTGNIWSKVLETSPVLKLVVQIAKGLDQAGLTGENSLSGYFGNIIQNTLILNLEAAFAIYKESLQNPADFWLQKASFGLSQRYLSQRTKDYNDLTLEESIDTRMYSILTMVTMSLGFKSMERMMESELEQELSWMKIEISTRMIGIANDVGVSILEIVEDDEFAVRSLLQDLISKTGAASILSALALGYKGNLHKQAKFAPLYSLMKDSAQKERNLVLDRVRGSVDNSISGQINLIVELLKGIKNDFMLNREKIEKLVKLSQSKEDTMVDNAILRFLLYNIIFYSIAADYDDKLSRAREVINMIFTDRDSYPNKTIKMIKDWIAG